MIYDVEKDGYGLLFDASGREIKYADWCETETGKVRICVINDKNLFTGEKVYKHFLAPLLFIRRGD